MYDQCILEQNKISYNTNNKGENGEIRAIFKGVAEDLQPDIIVQDLKNKGYNPGVEARFQCREGRPMLIILVIVPGHENKIKTRKLLYARWKYTSKIRKENEESDNARIVSALGTAP
ncbi:hypothetical protein JTB14_014947 [Gonioctena quinquepunctata]|nr:hypothetical protein JTB14_014947 [Gonioctena quinquepunctata]